MEEQERYPVEILDDDDDNGTMPENVAELAEAVVGHRIVNVKHEAPFFFITLDNGTYVKLMDTDDCCAYTEVESFLLNTDKIDHIITGVGTTDGYTQWHIYADFADVLNISVGWSAGNPFYYGYGFVISVQDV